MDNILTLIVGFLGALVGAGSSILTTYFQNKSQNKRERTKLASQLAIKDFELQ